MNNFLLAIPSDLRFYREMQFLLPNGSFVAVYCIDKPLHKL